MSLIILPIFIPSFFLEFAHNNDYFALSYDHSKKFFGYPESQFLFWIGRPLGALLLNAHFYFIQTFSDFPKARIVSFIIYIFTFFSIYKIFAKISTLKNSIHAFAAFLIMLLPSSVLYVCD